MEEFSALAARVAASVGELRGCLILSRDGLVLGAFPEGEEGLVKPAWLKFAVLGEPEKGFVEFGEEVWTYVRRGPYAAFAVCARGVRPGLLIDQLEQMLYAAEEIRARREALRVPEAPPAPSGKPRTSLHPEVKPEARPPAAAQGSGRQAGSAEAPTEAPAKGPARGRAPGPGTSPDPSSRPAPAPAAAPTPAAAPARKRASEEEGMDVDRVLLAQEFSRLLQESRRDDEGSTAT